jgi:hypothetical protein
VTEPSDEGRIAFRDGEPKHANPYDRISDPDSYYEWAEGYESAQSGGNDDDDEEDGSGEGDGADP